MKEVTLLSIFSRKEKTLAIGRFIHDEPCYRGFTSIDSWAATFPNEQHDN